MTVGKTAQKGYEETALEKVASAVGGAPLVEVPTNIDEDAHQYPGPAKLAVIMASIYISVFLIALDRTIIGVAIPKITDQFDSINDIGWYGSAYQLTAAAFILPYGRIYTFCSTKWTFLSGIVIFEIGSAICGAAPTSTAFIIGRAISGFGSSGIFTGAIAILVQSAPLHKRPMLQGLIGACFGIASVAGPLLGGAFTQSSIGWPWCFYINLPLGGATIVALFFFLHLKENKPQITWTQLIWKLDPIGNMFFLPAIVCLVLALQWGGVTYAWSNGRVIGLLVAFAVLAIIWVGIQYRLRHTNATVPSRVLLNRAVSFGGAFQFMLGSTFLVVVLYMPIWFQAIKGVSPVRSGIDTIPMILGLVVASILSGALVARVGYYLPFLYLSCVLMPLGAGLLTTLKPSSSNSAWIGYQILLGFGIGSGMQQSNLAVQTCLADSDVPTGISIIFFFQMLGGSVFSAVAQNIFIDRFIKQVAGIPGLNAEMIVKTGATAIRDRVPKEVLPRVIDAYNYSITHGPFLVSTIIACLAIFGTVGMEWRSVKEKKNAQMAKHGQKRRSKDVEADATSEVASADGRTPSTTTVEKPQPSSVDIESEKHHHKETAV